MKKWKLWAIGIFIVIFAYAALTGVSRAKDDIEAGKINESSNENDQNNESKDEIENEESDTNDEEDSKSIIEVNEEVEVNGATVTVQSVTIEGDEASIYFIWKHWTQYDEAHMDLLVTTSVLQDEEYLEVAKNEDKFLKQIKKGVDGPMQVSYKLIDKETPLEIRVRANTDEGETEVITVNIE